MRFNVLGPLTVTGDDGDAVALPAGRARTVLALLCAQAGQVVASDQLIDAAWGGAPPASAVTRLHSMISGLRRAMPSAAIRTSGAGYCLEVAEDATDLGAVRQLADRARSRRQQGDLEAAASCLLEALGSWRGAAFDGISCAALELEAERIAQERVALAEEYAEIELALGHHRALIAQLVEWVQQHPLREALRAALMRALARSGRQADAITTYLELRQRLTDELGVDPAPYVQDLYQAILAGDRDLLTPSDPPTPVGSPPLAPRPAQLPADISDFTGRASTVTLLRTTLRAQPGTVPVIVISGPGGIGKSALAVHTAHLEAMSFPDGQLYADLGGTSGTPASPTDVLARFLRDLGVPAGDIPADEAGRAAWYRSVLDRRSLLVVLDDARDEAQVRPLLPGSASCAVLVTTRNKLSGLAASVPVELDMLEPAEGLQLFGRIVGGARAGREPDAGERVVNACAGLPLAIRIAAARLAARPAWNVADIARGLEKEHRRLAELRAGDLAVQASFRLSYDSLPAPVAQAFVLLGLAAPGSLRRDAAAALFSTDTDRAGQLLEALADASLLQAPGPDRYQLHDLLRLFAAGLAASQLDPGEREQATNRMLTSYATTLRAASRTLVQGDHLPRFLENSAFQDDDTAGFGSHQDALAWFDREAGAIVWAVRSASAHERHDIAIALASFLLMFATHLAAFDGLAETQLIGIASARMLRNTRAEQFLLTGLGTALTWAGDYPRAIAAYEQALTVSQESGIPMGVAAAHNNLGTAYYEQGHYAQALNYFRLAEATCRSAGNSYQTGQTLANIAETQRDLGHYEEASASFREAIKFHQSTGDQRTASDWLGEAIARTGLGDTYRLLGSLHESMAEHQAALSIYRKLGSSQRDLMTALDKLAETQVAAGSAAQARESWSEAIDLADAAGNPRAAALRERLSHPG